MHFDQHMAICMPVLHTTFFQTVPGENSEQRIGFFGMTWSLPKHCDYCRS